MAKASAEAAAAEEEDDYLTMSLPHDPPPPTTNRETLTQARLRKQREAEVRGRPKSKAELAAEQVRKREEGLARSALEQEPENKGLRIMQKLGFEVGGRLGRKVAPPASTTPLIGVEARSTAGLGSNVAPADDEIEMKKGLEESTAPSAPLGLLEPIAVEMKSDRGGIGADSEKKRKFRAEVEARAQGEKRAKLEGEGFRERVAREREERRVEGLVRAARGVAEGLDEEENMQEQTGEGGEGRERKGKGKGRRPLKKVNVLWRGALKERLVKERDRRLVHDFQGSFGTLPQDTGDPEMDADDRLALGTEAEDGELDEEDEELEEFEALDGKDKLERLVGYLRAHWQYCFWCKYRYPDEEMDGCPGIDEDAHG